MTILVVDDVDVNLIMLSALLGKMGVDDVVAESSPERALKLAIEKKPELVIVDYMMPGMNGIAFVKHLRAERGYADLPVIMVTTSDQRSVRVEALEAGATDFLTKPLDPPEFKARVRNVLRLSDALRSLNDRAAWLAAEVEKSTAALAAREEEILIRLSKAVEHRDFETSDHINRMAAYTYGIARQLGLPKAQCATLRLAATMHDVGKLGVADAILRKPGPLTADEREAMERHAQFGANILSGSSSDLIQLAAEIALTHHERFDGTGYPRGLTGTDIPLSGRITAVADVYDALTSERPYKKAWSRDEAAAYLREQSGKHFDPACVDAMLAELGAAEGTRHDAAA
jgi:response regulator RpfG family c-di-GMP phosphodiesterase